MAREKVEFDVIGRDVGGSKAFRDVGDAAGQAADKIDHAGRAATAAGQAVVGLGDKTDQAGEQADDAGEQYRGLAHEIAEVEGSVRRLAAEIDRTGNKDLVKDLRRQQTELRKLTRIKDLLPGDEIGADLAEQVSVSFAARLGPVLARAPMSLGAGGGAVAAIAAPLALGAATVVGAAVGAAIIGGVGAAGIAGGLAGASKDPAVKAAATELGANLSGVLRRSTAGFVPETLDAIDAIDERVLRLEPSFNRAGTAASKLLAPLTDGLLDAGENALPGVIDALERGEPVMEAVAEGARDLGDAVGDGLSDLAPYADEGARALSLLLKAMELGVRGALQLAESVSWLYQKGEILGAIMSGNVEDVFRLAGANKEAEGASSGLSGVLGELGIEIRNTGQEAITAEDAARDLKGAFDDLFGAAMSADRAAIEYREGIQDLNKELRNGKRTLDINTQAGRDNTAAVLDQIDRIKDLRDARLEQGESIDSVDGKYRKEIGSIRAKLKAMGYEKSEIDALLGKYEQVPARVSTRVTAETRQAEANLAKVRSLISQIQSKRVVITTQHNQVITRSEGRNVGIGDGIGGRASGGPTYRGETYWVGEQGPELVTFRDNGYVLNARQSQEIATTSAAASAGMSQAAGGGVSEDALFRAFVRALQAAPVVRMDSGRMADLLARTGG